MFSGQQILTLFLILTMGLSLASCGAESTTQPTPEMPEPPAQVQETPEPAPVPSPEPELEVTEGTETYRGFQMDNVLHAPEGAIHYHIYVPDGYDGSEPYALFLTLPGYEGLYFQGMGQNLYSEDFTFEALNYNDCMIVAALQLSDWGETSAEQTIALTEYLLGHYNIDQERVYAEGYSGGGETMSQVIGIAMLVWFVFHHIWNRAWYKSIGRGRPSPYRAVQTALNFLLFTVVLGMLLSGLILPQHILDFLPPRRGETIAWTLHLPLAYWGFLLMSLHLCLCRFSGRKKET